MAFTELPGRHSDAALVLTGFSLWINYYLEGLRWMFENYQINGIYMDDVSFDRDVVKRIRKIIAQYHPDALIDLHSNILSTCKATFSMENVAFVFMFLSN
jgi:preprotein translocase subunit Sec63